MVRCTVKKLYCLCTENMWNHKRRQKSSVSSKKRDINLTRIEVGDIQQKVRYLLDRHVRWCVGRVELGEYEQEYG